jgi:hypothetical protein
MQTLRDVYHAISWPKLEPTKVRSAVLPFQFRKLTLSRPNDLNLSPQSIIYTRNIVGWIIPWAHGVKHVAKSPEEVKIITVTGEGVIGMIPSDPEDVEPGTYYAGRSPTRHFEPLVSRLA